LEERIELSIQKTDNKPFTKKLAKFNNKEKDRKLVQCAIVGAASL
jgi:hypothetical protein